VPEPANELVLDGRGPVRALLLHGLTGTPAEFAYVAHYLHYRGGVSVECRRLVNHGQPIGVLAATSWEELVASAEAHFANALAAARQREQALVVGGLSLGAVLSLLLAAEHRDDVSGVMALSPTLFYDGWAVPWTHRLLGLADRLQLKNVLYLREGPPYGLKDPALRARVASAYESASLHHAPSSVDLGYAHFPVRLFCEMRHLIATCIARLPEVHAPLLVLQARDDEVTSPRNATFIRDHVSSAYKEIVLLENSYHIITADLDRVRVSAEMTHFCQARATRATTPDWRMPANADE
jgi:carboxylesterase